MVVTPARPEPTGDGSVRCGSSGPAIGIVLPRHSIGAEGSDVLEWHARTTTGADEVETEYVAGALRAVLQHDASETSWRVRASLDNSSDEPISVSQVRLDIRPGDGLAWVWGAGAAGLVVLVTRDGGLWGFSLRRGTLRRECEDVVWLDAGTTLAPGRRTTFELVGRRCHGWDEVASMLPAWLPPLAVRGGEPVDLALPDAGVVAAGCSILEAPDGTEIRGAGVQQVNVHGVFGEVDLELAFAPTLADAVDRAGRQVARLVREVPGAVHQLDGTGPDERARGLDRTARRLVLLQSAHSQEAADVVRGWLLTGMTDLLQAGGTPGPFSLAALAGEIQRRDDPQALQALMDAVPTAEAEPGMVLALTRVWAVVWGLGQDPEPVRQALAWVSSQPARTRLEALEHALVAGDRAAAPELLAVLGAGLPGAPVPLSEAWQQAYAVALASLVTDEDQSAPRLVQAAEMVARRLTARDPHDPDVLAWLLLGER